MRQCSKPLRELTHLAQETNTIELDSSRLVGDDLGWRRWRSLTILARERWRRRSFRWWLWRRLLLLLVVDIIDWCISQRMSALQWLLLLHGLGNACVVGLIHDGLEERPNALCRKVES